MVPCGSKAAPKRTSSEATFHTHHILTAEVWDYVQSSAEAYHHNPIQCMLNSTRACTRVFQHSPWQCVLERSRRVAGVPGGSDNS